MTRYEFTYAGEHLIRMRMRDDDGTHVDYEFNRKQFTEFIDNAFFMLVETMPHGVDSGDDGMVD
jgi:hypothetical protein